MAVAATSFYLSKNELANISMIQSALFDQLDIMRAYFCGVLFAKMKRSASKGREGDSMLSISDRLPLNARCAYNRIVKVGSHHCRPGGSGADRGRPCGGSDPVSGAGFLTRKTALHRCGRGAWVPQDGRSREEWTEEKRQRHSNTGWTGQVVAGLRLNEKTVLEPLAGRFPDILEDEDEIAPSEMACSQVIASEPQRLITNRFAAQAVAGYLNELFGERTLSTHVTFFHAKKMYMRGDRIQEG